LCRVCLRQNLQNLRSANRSVPLRARVVV
jgi:hypothetical protein